jgi:putative ABC transport system ATP-binding protein
MAAIGDDPIHGTQASSVACRNVSRVVRSGDAMLTIVDDVTLSIAKSSAVAIVGRSGSGKSTLLGLMAGLDRPSRGSVLIDERAIENMSEDALSRLRRDHVGFVFQNFELLGDLTARENVLLPLELKRVAGAVERCDALLAAVGLEARAHHYPSQLSGGEQQRVALARAFSSQPSVLFADEPTGNLDAETGERVLSLLLDLRAKSGTTLIAVTHDARVAERFDRVVRLDAGRVIEDSAA